MSTKTLFCDRLSAGEQLAAAIFTALDKLKSSGGEASPTVYALPRGGIPVAIPVARRLGCPLEVIATKKIALPANPELALGAVTAKGTVLWALPERLKNKPIEALSEAKNQAHQKAISQQFRFAPYCPQISPEGAIAILVDDGIATGMTITTAAMELQTYCPAQIWLASPVAPKPLIQNPPRWCDRTIILATPDPFHNVGRFYKNFTQVETQQALSLLQQYNQAWRG